MRVTQKSRLRLRLESGLFVVLVVGISGLLGWLSTRYHAQFDWTANARNTLSEASQALLDRLDQPISITAYATEDDVLRDQITELVARYQRAQPGITLEFVNPDTVPARVRELGIEVNGELVVTIGARSEHVQKPSETTLSNALQRASRAAERWLVFLQGHGERSPQRQANHDLSDWAAQLRKRGFHIQTLNLGENPVIPDNTSALVIASPQVDLLPGEVDLVRKYLEGGGNLLWLREPDSDRGTGALDEVLGVQPVAGVVVDPTTQLFGIGQPDMALITAYPYHPVTQDFSLLTLFPQAQGLTYREDSGWEVQPLLTTAKQAWAETGPIEGEVALDPAQDTAGPLDIGLALQRKVPTEGDADAEGKLQRVAVIGDGDFLANTYLGNGGNLDLGISLANWLSEDDQLLAIPARSAIDTRLVLTESEVATLGLGHLIGVPGVLLLTGLAIWWRRRRA